MSAAETTWRAPTRAWPLVAALLVMLSVGVANAGNLAFNSWVGRALPPEEFGTYAVAFAVISLGAVPINAIRLAVIKETAASNGSTAAGAPDVFAAIGRYINGWLPAVMLLVCAVALGAALIAWLPLETGTTALLAVLILATMLVVYADRGLLHGSLRLGSVSLSVLAEHIVRLGMFGALIVVLEGSEAPLIAILVGLFGAWLANRHFRMASRYSPAAVTTAGKERSFAATTAIFLIAYIAHTALFTADLLVAGLLFDGAGLGAYAALSITARILLFTNLGIAELILPVAAMRERAHLSSIARSGLLGVLIPLPLLLAYVTFPHWSLSLFLGTDVSSFSSHLPVLAIAMYLLSLAGILLAFLLARGLGWPAAGLAATAALLEVVLLALHHDTPGQIVANVLIASSVYFVSLVSLAAWASSAGGRIKEGVA
jgi:O-antigen/teichoic acid export membrane protein